MSRVLKVVHILALTLFLGSIFSHIVAGVVGGAVGGPGFLAARTQIEAATRLLTLPGLGLAILSGVGLALLAPRRPAWMAIHADLAVAIAILAMAVIAPAGRAALSGAQAVAQGHGDLEALRSALMTEHIAGAANILLTVAVVVLGVYRPAMSIFAKRRRAPRVLQRGA